MHSWSASDGWTNICLERHSLTSRIGIARSRVHNQATVIRRVRSDMDFAQADLRVSAIRDITDGVAMPDIDGDFLEGRNNIFIAVELKTFAAAHAGNALQYARIAVGVPGSAIPTV